ncbi:hypothetical protein F2Q69_00052153 [Brassica cretica]|uniref:Uncharacterized protein n=1 Tax=Brassica cretica TaxID=69181 RepID=A0A8S9MMD3_BRACR|nr:hypothetical protein F2Q69_00052153 [Brassica cretica]
MAGILRNASLLRRSLFSSEVFTRAVVGTSSQHRGFAAKVKALILFLFEAKKKSKSDGNASSEEAKNGTFYNLNGKNYHGKEALKKFLRLNEPVQEELMTKLKEKLIVDEAADKESESEEEEDSGRVLVSSESTDDEAPAPVVAAAAVVES